MTRTQAGVFDRDRALLSRVSEGEQDRTGVVTSVVDGVLYLQDLHTSNAKFVLQNGTKGSK